MTLKDKVVDLCKEKGLTVRELERRAKIGERTIQHWDKSKPDALRLYSVAGVLEVPMEELLSVYDPDLERVSYVQSLRNEIERLKGQKNTAIEIDDGLTDQQIELYNTIPTMSKDESSELLSYARFLVARRKSQGDQQ